jgi:hypothetical protein
MKHTTAFLVLALVAFRPTGAAVQVGVTERFSMGAGQAASVLSPLHV